MACQRVLTARAVPWVRAHTVRGHAAAGVRDRRGEERLCCYFSSIAFDGIDLGQVPRSGRRIERCSARQKTGNLSPEKGDRERGWIGCKPVCPGYYGHLPVYMAVL